MSSFYLKGEQNVEEYFQLCTQICVRNNENNKIELKKQSNSFITEFWMNIMLTRLWFNFKSYIHYL